MDVFMLGRCSHEFSWPRRAANGEYYQVCLVCASAYQYDWKTMRRGNRVDEPMADTTTVRRRSSKKQPTWMPRLGGCGHNFRFDTAGRISAPGTKA